MTKKLGREHGVVIWLVETLGVSLAIGALVFFSHGLFYLVSKLLEVL